MMALALAIAAVLTAAALIEAIAERRDARRIPPPGSTVNVAGHRWHVQREGDGDPPVVFESGIAASSISWCRVQPLVARFTTACSYDRAGYAWTESSPTPCEAGGQAEQLREVMTAMGVRAPWILVAHSYGALIALLLAHRHPECVAGLVLVDGLPPAEWTTPGPAERRIVHGAILFSRTGEWLARFGIVRLLLWLLKSGAAGPPRSVLRAFGAGATAAVERVVGEVLKLPADHLPAVRAHWSAPRSFATMARHFGRLVESSREARAVTTLGDLPLVVIAGAQHDSEGMRRQRGLAELSRRGRLVVATRGRHWVQLDELELVARVVQEVVAEVRLRGPTTVI
jgi:pimeloyl-ACP methyl ester carboxylesterase